MTIKLAATGVAKFASASPAKKRSLLRPYKKKKSGEAKGRSNYYQRAISAIKSFHKAGNDDGIIADAIAALTLKMKSASSLERLKCVHNVRVLQAYRTHFGNRKFEPIAGKRLFCKVGNLTITAQPELTVEENGKPLFIKLYFSQKKPGTLEIPMLLHLIRNSAVNVGLKIKPENVFCFDMEGNVHPCPGNIEAMEQTAGNLSTEIEAVWSSL